MAQSATQGDTVWELLRLILNWRVAFPVFAIIGLIALTFAFFARRSDGPQNPARQYPVTTTSVPAQDIPPPTISAYQLAASQSLEKLDDLLSLQASHSSQSSPAAPAHAAAIFASLAGNE